jgi:hypothetical protein
LLERFPPPPPTPEMIRKVADVIRSHAADMAAAAAVEAMARTDSEVVEVREPSIPTAPLGSRLSAPSMTRAPATPLNVRPWPASSDGRPELQENRKMKSSKAVQTLSDTGRPGALGACDVFKLSSFDHGLDALFGQFLDHDELPADARTGMADTVDQRIIEETIDGGFEFMVDNVDDAGVR